MRDRAPNHAPEAIPCEQLLQRPEPRFKTGIVIITGKQDQRQLEPESSQAVPLLCEDLPGREVGLPSEGLQ